nr:MAG TPA: hypothetical protein [Caudoviricetes sp.]
MQNSMKQEPRDFSRGRFSFIKTKNIFTLLFYKNMVLIYMRLNIYIGINLRAYYKV